MNTRQVIEAGSKHLVSLKGHTLDLLSINTPRSLQEAVDLAKIVSKLSPMLANLIELDTVAHLKTPYAPSETMTVGAGQLS